MKKLISIAFLNFKQAIRDKFFIGVILFFIFYLSFCLLLGELSPGHEHNVLRNIGLVGIELTTVILIIFSFTVSFFKEKDTGLLELYLANYSRLIYISGKILGYLFIALFYLMFSALAYLFILNLYAASHIALFVAIYPLFLKIAIIICFTCLFSCLSSTATIALLCSLFLYAGSELMPVALEIVKNQNHLGQERMLKIIYALLPNMDKLDIKYLAVYGELPSLEYFFWITLYTFIYTLFLSLITVFIFQKKEY